MEAWRDGPPGARPRCIVPATPCLARRLARSLSPLHEREVRELSRLDGARAVELSLAASCEAYAVLAPSGTVLLLMGVEAAGLLTNAAMVWMLASPEAVRRPARVLRSARWGLARAFAATNARTLLQFIPGWYGTGAAFARRLGFTLTPLRKNAAGAAGRTVFLAQLARRDFVRAGQLKTLKKSSKRKEHAWARV